MQNALEAPPELAPEEKDKALTTLKLLVKDCEARIDRVTVLATPGTSIYVDGKAVGVAPLAGTVVLDRGAHVFEAREASLVVAKAAVNVAGGKSFAIELTKPAVPAPPVALCVWSPQTEGALRQTGARPARVLDSSVHPGRGNGRGRRYNARFLRARTPRAR